MRPANLTKAKRSLPRGRIGKNAQVPITRRQRQMLSLMASGLANREIALRLGISVRTVEFHRYHLMRRLRVRNVAQLLRTALKRRMVPKTFIR